MRQDRRVRLPQGVLMALGAMTMVAGVLVGEAAVGLPAGGAVAGLYAAAVQEPPAQAPSAFVNVRFRRNTSGMQNPINAGFRVTPDGRFIFGTNLTFREMIRDAYGLQWRPTRMVIGGPAWLDTERYDFMGELAQRFEQIPRNDGLPPEGPALLQPLLEERAGVRVRHETVDTLVYALTIISGDGTLGPGLTEADASCVGPFELVPASLAGRMAAGPMCAFDIMPNEGAEFHGITIDELARILALYPIIDRVVIDRTGLTGTYNASLRYQPAFVQTPTGLLPAQFGQPGVVLLPDAVPAQLGLALERSVAPLPRLVIEQAERPAVEE